MPKISIIIPCYGVENYIDRCLTSIVNQSLEDIEIILVDDQSIDRTPILCDAWQNKDARIHVIHKKVNEGLGYARNTGIEAATGEYVAFIDSDDYVENQMFAKLYDFAMQFDLDVAFCGFNRVKNGNIVDLRVETKVPVVYDSNDKCRNVLKGMLSSENRNRITDYEMSVWHAIYKKSLIDEKKIRFPSERVLISEDIIFHIDFLSSSQKVGFLPDALYNYCLNPISLTAVYRKDRFVKICNLYEAILSKVRQNGNDWGEKDLSRFFALNLRFVISNCAKYIDDMGADECYKLVREYSESTQCKSWVYPYIKSFPMRYKLFYFALKYKLYKVAVKMVRLKT